jgi:hypothetical protein
MIMAFYFLPTPERFNFSTRNKLIARGSMCQWKGWQSFGGAQHYARIVLKKLEPRQLIIHPLTKRQKPFLYFKATLSQDRMLHDHFEVAVGGALTILKSRR